MPTNPTNGIIGEPVVDDNPERSRYELKIDGHVVGVADYQRDGENRLVFPHTEIDGSRRGQGLGAVLVKAALDDVRSQGKQIIARCWYVAEFIDLHPEYRDLLVRP
ncbi:MAG: N-acetyltransferase [Acidobacteria bacterium]|nr:N-acetyltransferase [Acidobacteriota bacterium]